MEHLDLAYSSMEEPSARGGPLRHEPQLDFRANLDILRSIAVLLVLLDHVLDMVASKHHLRVFHDFIGYSGRLGVLLFFVHTSLVLNFSLAQLQTSGWQLVRTFFVRRTFRLYPLSAVRGLRSFYGSWRLLSRGCSLTLPRA
jgi:peptidoglycan/LPS O-acetylase OafA/YrhL